MTPQPDAAGTLADSIAAFRKAFRGATRRLSEARSALDGLARSTDADDLVAVARAASALEALDLSAMDAQLEQDRLALVGKLQTQVQTLRTGERARLLQALNERAAAADVPMTLVSEGPLTVRLGPVDIVLDLSAGEATVLYAREPVATAPCDAVGILRARKEALAGIRRQAQPSDAFFETLALAYQMALAGRGLGPGERVDLVDLLGPLALARVGIDGWRQTARKGLAGYPRHLLAYQLQRLRREDGLRRPDGRRVELGVATGGSTKKKQNVLFVPTGHGEGAYQLSLRITAPGEA